MFITIKRNIKDLTDAEKESISTAKSFAHANEILMIRTQAGNDIWWQPTDAAQAYQYLKTNNVKEL